jgi:membrane protease YdiL (CAAX protease family)
MSALYQNNLFFYVVLAYGITWAILIPLIFHYNNLSFKIREIWHSLGSLGPAIAALLIINREKLNKGLIPLKERMEKLPDKRLFIIAFSPLIILCLALIFEAIFGVFSFQSFLTTNNLTGINDLILYFLPSLCYGFFEEIGWRGYLLPKLQRSLTALKATILLTIIWYLWHIPMFFYRLELFFALILMFPLLISGSIVFTFLFNQSGGNLLVIILLHISYDIVSSSALSFSAIILVSTLFVFIDIRAIKVYGTESLSLKEKIIL